MEKCIIVAVADNNAIGKDNALLWHISEDLRFFKRNTLGCPVIMGRKTYESIGRPLPSRINIVVSRSYETPDEVAVTASLEEAFQLAETTNIERCFVIGGGQIYMQAMNYADRLIVTHVHTVIQDADTFFPEIDSSVWEVVERSELMHDEESGYDFEFVTYLRKHE